VTGVLRKSPPVLDRFNLQTNVITLLIGCLGALVFFLLKLPTPFLSGPMVSLAISVLMGRPAVLDRRLCNAGLLIGGMTMGMGLTPEMLSGFVRYPISLAMLVVVVISTMMASYWLLRRFGGWDNETAFFASVPGALSVVIATAADSKADQMRVVIVQSVRLFVLFAFAPSILALEGLQSVRGVVADKSAALWLIAVLAMVSTICALVFRRFRMAAPFLFAGLLVAGALRLSGYVDATMPEWLAQVGFLLVGVFVGTRFNGITPANLKPLLGLALVSVILSFLLTLAAAAITARFIPGVGFSQVVVAYAPGALEGMIMLGAAMGLEPIFVGLHHLVRFLGISLLLPVVTAIFLKRDSS
jgi:uncharacterized protein